VIRPNGYIIHSDAWRVIIATGFTRKSANRKTGGLIQIWILSRRIDPVRAIAAGTDKHICGDCPLRGDGTGRGRVCYVNVGQAPLAVFTAWQNGSYPVLPSFDLFAGKRVRFGAYGDPVHIPLAKVKAIAAASFGFVGYTHQWRESGLRGYRQFLMASTETEKDTRKAWRKGWRTFRLSDSPADGEVQCPSLRGISCEDCLLCAGMSRKAKSITIPAHGTGKIHFESN
jgi:hypothetical protein